MKIELISKGKLDISQSDLSKLQRDTLDDLQLKPVLKIMSQDKQYLQAVVLKTWFSPLVNKDAVVYRQKAVIDAMSHQEQINQLYQLVTNTIEEAKQGNWAFDSSSSSYQLLSSSLEIKVFLKSVKQIIKFTDSNWKSQNFLHFFKLLNEKFAAQRFKEMNDILNLIISDKKKSYPVQLKRDFSGNVQELEYEPNINSVTKLFNSLKNHYEKKEFKFTIAERDNNALNALAENDNQAKYGLAIEVTNTANEFENFFNELRFQLAFLLSVNNLNTYLKTKKISTIFPIVSKRTNIKNLKNTTLQIKMDNVEKVIGNDLKSKQLSLLVISGANQGGKTTYLISLGQSQIMMASGMFVTAQKYCSPLYKRVFTHFKREEDPNLRNGKLVDELKKMQEIVNQVKPASLVLMNESFSATNEHEGSQINAQVISGLVNSCVTVLVVTYQFEVTKMLSLHSDIQPIFLRPDRNDNGNRDFKMHTGLPSKTSYGLDIFNKFFK